MLYICSDPIVWTHFENIIQSFVAHISHTVDKGAQNLWTSFECAATLLFTIQMDSYHTTMSNINKHNGNNRIYVFFCRFYYANMSK